MDKQKGEKMQTKLDFKKTLKDMFSFKNIIIYILIFFISKFSFIIGNREICAGGIASIASSISVGVPAIISLIIVIISEITKFKTNTFLISLIYMAILFVLLVWKKPGRSNKRIEKIKLSRFVVFSVAIVEIMYLFLNEFSGKQFVFLLIQSILTYIIYKIEIYGFNFIKIYSRVSVYSWIDLTCFSILVFLSFMKYPIFDFTILFILLTLIGFNEGLKKGIYPAIITTLFYIICIRPFELYYILMPLGEIIGGLLSIIVKPKLEDMINHTKLLPEGAVWVEQGSNVLNINILNRLKKEIPKSKENHLNEQTDIDKKIKNELENIGIKVINIEKIKDYNKRLKINLKIKSSDRIEDRTKLIKKTISEILGETLELIEEKSNENNEKELVFTSKNKYKLEIRKYVYSKNENKTLYVSDLILQDGKELLTIAENKKDKKNDKILINTIENLLNSGFNKDKLKILNETIKLLNTKNKLNVNANLETFNLYSGEVEFVKSNSTPTYIYRKDEVTIIEQEETNTECEYYLKQLNNDDILISFSEDAFYSNMVYKITKNWVKEVLKQAQTRSIDELMKIFQKEINENLRYFNLKNQNIGILIAKISKIK